MSVAQTIAKQLGGNKFAVMTGAKFYGAPDRLVVKLPSGFASKGINRVVITLEPSDLYTVAFNKVRSNKETVIAKHESVYAEDLQPLFKSETGLDTHL